MILHSCVYVRESLEANVLPLALFSVPFTRVTESINLTRKNCNFNGNHRLMAGNCLIRKSTEGW